MDERVRVKRTAVGSFASAWKTGWNQGRGGEKAPDWLDVRLLGFAGTDKGVRAVLMLPDGSLTDVRLNDVQYPESVGAAP